MVHVHESSILVGEVLNEGSIVDVSLEVFDVILDVFGFMGDWEVKNVAA